MYSIPLREIGHNCFLDTLSGECIFRNQYLDTLRILTYAQLNDSWKVSTDTNGIDYYGTVSAVLPQVIDNQNDSIKVITLQAYSGSNPITNHYNGLTIQLSKSHGFYIVPDLYAFPYFDSSVYYHWITPYPPIPYEHKRMDKEKTLIDVVPIDFPVKFQPGNEWIMVTIDEHFIPLLGYIHDSILSYSPLSQDSVQLHYYRNRLVDSLTNIPPSYYQQVHWFGNRIDTIVQDTLSSFILRNTLIENVVPHNNTTTEEFFRWHFFSEPCTGLIMLVDSFVEVTPLSGSIYDSWGYLQKFGMVSHHDQFSNAPGSHNWDWRMAYIKMGGCTMGQSFWFAPNSRSEINSSLSSIHLYPNPSESILFLNMPDGVLCHQIHILSIEGHILRSFPSSPSWIDMSFLSQGNYIVAFETSEGPSFKMFTKR